MSHSREMIAGRTIIAVLEHGENFFTALREVCTERNLRQGYIPMFVAGFAEADLVGTCQRIDNPEAPVWSTVSLSGVEAVGGGILAWDPIGQTIAPHIHVAVGIKARSATGHTSHLVNANVQFTCEMTIVEITDPHLTRQKQPDLFDVPILRLDDAVRQAN